MFPPNSPHMERIRVKNENAEILRMAIIRHHRENRRNWTVLMVKRLWNSRLLFKPLTQKGTPPEQRQMGKTRRVQSL